MALGGKDQLDGDWSWARACQRSQRHCSVAIELDQPLVTDPEVMRDLVDRDVSDLAAQTIGVAGSESRDRPAEDADLVGKHTAVRAAPSRQRYTAVQAEQRPPVWRLVLDDDLNVAHRRTEIGRQGAQRVVDRLFERIVETRLPTRIHLRNDARIGAGITLVEFSRRSSDQLHSDE